MDQWATSEATHPPLMRVTTPAPLYIVIPTPDPHFLIKIFFAKVPSAYRLLYKNVIESDLF